MSGVVAVYRWEIVKLLAQKRTYLGIGAAALVPVIFVTVLVFQSGGPNDVPLGRYIRDTGLAVPFVVLFFMSIWGLPLITALVAGDIVASESQNGTLKTILTRSRERGQGFAGEFLAALTRNTGILIDRTCEFKFIRTRRNKHFLNHILSWREGIICYPVTYHSSTGCSTIRTWSITS